MQNDFWDILRLFVFFSAFLLFFPPTPRSLSSHRFLLVVRRRDVLIEATAYRHAMCTWVTFNIFAHFCFNLWFRDGSSQLFDCFSCSYREVSPTPPAHPFSWRKQTNQSSCLSAMELVNLFIELKHIFENAFMEYLIRQGGRVVKV